MEFRSKVDWSPERVERLTVLWNRGTTPHTIGEIFKLPVTAIEVMARNLNLPDQPVFRADTVPSRATRVDDGCCWPIEDGRRVFCGEKTPYGKSYCAEHSRRAYVQKPAQSRGIPVFSG